MRSYTVGQLRNDPQQPARFRNIQQHRAQLQRRRLEGPRDTTFQVPTLPSMPQELSEQEQELQRFLRETYQEAAGWQDPDPPPPITTATLAAAFRAWVIRTTLMVLAIAFLFGALLIGAIYLLGGFGG